MKVQRQFYRDLQTWIKAGTPTDHPIFTPSGGICINYGSWCAHNNKRCGSISNSFIAAGLDSVIPFNFNYRDCFYETDNLEVYTNPARLAWILKHAK